MKTSQTTFKRDFEIRYGVSPDTGKPSAPNKAQHSPLPWRWNEMATIVATNDTPVASVFHRDWQRGPSVQEAQANARLIVRAVNHAGKLANALRHIEAYCQKQCEVDTDEALLWAQCVSIAGNALAAYKDAQK